MTNPDHASHPDSAPSGVAVFNIQRCSIHDGPGIRTTVFIKGCPLRCDWCHNPESLDGAPEVAITEGKCVSCGACAEAYPGEARGLIGEPRAVADLVAEIERDRPFFEASGCGVTFSGGEPLCYPSFLTACLKLCREKRLHTAVDTSGFASKKTVSDIARLADVLLYDLMHMDPAAHERRTGVDNGRILDNLRTLSGQGAVIWIRFPLIPGFNDDSENLEAMASFVGASEHHCRRAVDLAVGSDLPGSFGRSRRDPHRR